jgi:hypothetical protein
MFLVALVPPLWFRVMDPLVVAQAERDPRRIHFAPKRRQTLCERYQLVDEGAVEAMAGTAVAA